MEIEMLVFPNGTRIDSAAIPGRFVNNTEAIVKVKDENQCIVFSYFIVKSYNSI
jgi:hypothetical protein